MSESALGFGGFIGLSEEVTYGTPVTPSTLFVPIVRSTLGQQRMVQRRADLAAYRAAPVSSLGRTMLELGIDVGGQVEVIPQYGAEWLGALLEYAFGAVATTGSDPYEHTFTLDIDGPTGANGKALTMQKVRGLAPGMDRAELFSGCVISATELRVDARAEARLILDVIGRAAAGPSVPSGTPTFSDDEEVLAHHSSNIVWNSGTHDGIQSWSIKHDKRLARRAHVGSRFTDYPQPTGLGSVIITATREQVSDDLYDAYIAGDSGNLVITMTGAGGTTPGDHRIVSTCHNARIVSCVRNLDTAGVLRETVTWEASADASVTGWALALRNNNTAHM